MIDEIEREIRDIKLTLLARIIPDMPLEGDTRDYITKIITEFEFEYHFKEIIKIRDEE